VKVSDIRAQHLEDLKQEQGRLEELLFLVDQQRRPRLQKVLASLRAEISALESEQGQAPAKDASVQSSQSLPELRQRQSELEETLFIEPPERRGPVKKLLAQVREAIEAARERLRSEQKPAQQAVEPSADESQVVAEQKPGGPQAA